MTIQRTSHCGGIGEATPSLRTNLEATTIPFLGLNLPACQPGSGASSAWTTPTRALSFPHHDLRGAAGFGCENAIPSFYFRFTETPNLSGNETLASLLDGSEVLRTRIKFDHDDPKDIALWRNWGSDTLFAVSYEPGGDNNSFLGWFNLGGNLNAPDLEWFERVISGSTMLLELSWYSLGRVFFRFDLRGSAKALREAGCFVE